MQTFKLKAVLAAMIVSLGVTACGDSSSSSSTSKKPDPASPEPASPEPVAKKPVWTLYKSDARTSADGAIDGVYDKVELRSRSYEIIDGLILVDRVTIAADGIPDKIRAWSYANDTTTLPDTASEFRQNGTYYNNVYSGSEMDYTSQDQDINGTVKRQSRTIKDRFNRQIRKTLYEADGTTITRDHVTEYAANVAISDATTLIRFPGGYVHPGNLRTLDKVDHNGDGTFDHVTISTYRDNGQELTRKRKYWDQTSGGYKIMYAVTKSYVDSGDYIDYPKLTESFDASGALRYRDGYSYTTDANTGLVTMTILRDNDPNQPSGYKVFNQDGLLVEQGSISSEDSSVRINVTKYSYDAEGNVISFVLDYNNNGVLDSDDNDFRVDSTYNTDGLLTDIKRYSSGPAQGATTEPVRFQLDIRYFYEGDAEPTCADMYANSVVDPAPTNCKISPEDAKRDFDAAASQQVVLPQG